jgi:(1->4)-alpha-D-glucan 1-alpha-D-glucosylmutase
MRIPAATYRIQFTPDFGFADAQQIVSYLAELGISDIYASPIFKATEGSTHGYDVVDASQLNPALGTPEAFDELIAALDRRDMGWLQDIVPNHMAYDSENKLLMDVLENGLDSEYSHYFDIDWQHPYKAIRGKVLTPLLGDFYGNCLENGQIQLAYEESGFTANYYDKKIPLNIESYAQIITHDLSRLKRKMGRTHPDFVKLLGVLYLLKNISTETSPQQRRDQSLFIKELLWELHEDNLEIREFLRENIEFFNGEVGNPESFNHLEHLLDEQFFRLSFWKVGAEELNYRRFFTVNELICLRNEDLRVFEKSHELIFQLIESGKFTGLRIDHIDGLYNPAEYLQRLREKVGDTYIVVEKILEWGEEFPSDWAIEGTSGYEFLSAVNGLFCQNDNEQAFDGIYTRLTGLNADYAQLFADKKRLIADTNLAGDAENLANLFKRISGQYRYGRDFTRPGLKEAILEILVLFPVYRTYINSLEGASDRDRVYIREAIQKARKNIPQLVNELDLIEDFLLLNYDDSLSEGDKYQWLHFVMRFQQFSGPLMAKGIEDTLFYVYNRFISLNEVGSSPHQFGVPVKTFHTFNQKRQEFRQHSLNATSTHDTKRGEDVRARLNVLSEIPDEWEMQVRTWIELNRQHKQGSDVNPIPDANDEYFLYQTLVGAFPFKDEDYPQFIERIKAYATKAVREAKIHTAWLRPDTEYEEGFITFIEKIMQPGAENEFLEKLQAFQQRVAYYGIFNSLSQTLIKLTVPGVPDIYQGSELWNLSLVDPDNRRPVDYELRASLLQEMKIQAKSDALGLMAQLMANREDGRIKLFAIARTLAVRNQYLEVFQEGDYLPLKVAGRYQDHIVAFTRNYGQTSIMVVAPRLLTHLVKPGDDPLGEKFWADTMLQIPHGGQFTWKNAFTEQTLTGRDVMGVGQLFQHFPVALLVHQAG